MECNELWNTYTNLKLKYRVAATSKIRPDEALLEGLRRASDEAMRALRQHEMFHTPASPEPVQPVPAPEMRDHRGGAILLPSVAAR